MATIALPIKYRHVHTYYINMYHCMPYKEYWWPCVRLWYRESTLKFKYPYFYPDINTLLIKELYSSTLYSSNKKQINTGLKKWNIHQCFFFQLSLAFLKLICSIIIFCKIIVHIFLIKLGFFLICHTTYSLILLLVITVWWTSVKTSHKQIELVQTCWLIFRGIREYLLITNYHPQRIKK